MIHTVSISAHPQGGKMEDEARVEENQDEQPDLPMSEVARLVEAASFSSIHVRKVRRLLKGMRPKNDKKESEPLGYILIVVGGDGTIPAHGIYRLPHPYIVPTEK